MVGGCGRGTPPAGDRANRRTATWHGDDHRSVVTPSRIRMVTTPHTADCMDLIRRRAAENGDDSYGDFVSAVPFDYYRRRVKGLGFAGLGRVLDVGCGFGHWTAVLAEVNDEAVGIDQSAPRLAIANEVARAMSLDNVTFDLGDAGRLPYPDESFRGVFCYGVFMFLD